MNSPPPTDPPRWQEPRLDPPFDVLLRYNARLLDPTKATILATQRPGDVRPTVYVADRLIVQRGIQHGVREDLDRALVLNNLAPTDPARQFTLGAAPADVIPLVPTDPTRDDGRAPGKAPDAWQVLQTLRTLRRDGDGVHLDHLLNASQHSAGKPFVDEHAYTPVASYGVPGFGGRQPVGWVGPVPRRDDERKARRPVVAILDTAVDTGHPWFSTCLLPEFAPPRALAPSIANPFEGTLDSDAGHGTFIAGLVLQHCPDAYLLSVPIMGGDGLVVESDLVAALWSLVDRQQAALDGGQTGDLIDVVVLSLGYYHETPTDSSADLPLLTALRELAVRGVAVVCAAGNDATDRPLFPAFFASLPADADAVPMSAVGALNPNGTVAMFSNVGPWVRYWRIGASVVSSHQRINASMQAAVASGGRESIDPDDYTGGFAVWSGTSFAAPVLAGEIAAALCADTGIDLVDRGAAVTRARTAITHVEERVPEHRPDASTVALRPRQR